MFKTLRDRKGQNSAIQYALTFFLIIGVVTTMAVYVRRAVQGKIYDARNYMFMTANAVYSNRQLNLVGVLSLQYEPYYEKRSSWKATDSIESDIMLPTGANSTGIFEKVTDQTFSGQTVSQEAPASFAR